MKKEISHDEAAWIMNFAQAGTKELPIIGKYATQSLASRKPPCFTAGENFNQLAYEEMVKK